MAIKQDLTDDQIISEIETALKGYNLGDIKRVSKRGLTIAGFILCSCLIDHIAGFRYERIHDKKGKVRGSRKRYVDFVDGYMAQYGYEGEKLYDQLRCRVVHAYTSSDEAFAFDLMHNNQQELGAWSQPKNRKRLD